MAFGFDPAAIPSTLANRVLERETWAQSCLAAHAGSVFVVEVGPAATAMRIDPAGKIEPAPSSGDAPALTLTLSPLALPAFLADPRRWDDFVAAAGDPALAATLKGLAETLPWFVERAFAAALGPVVGLRVADAGRQLLRFPEYAATRVGESVASYARDEADLVARGADARSLAVETAALAARVEALAARVEALGARLASAPPAQRTA